jgi:polysaccharide export outer membrane protein
VAVSSGKNLEQKGNMAFLQLGGEDFSEQERLAQLWNKRMQEQRVTDYPIGPGDVLELNVSTVDELTNRTVRVSSDGTIALPFIGEVQAAGLTEKQLRSEMHTRLEKYMHSPQINLLVREYRSRQVAVVGAVEKPGLYNLASTTDTILDVLSLAGGMKADAAPRINLIPADPLDTAQTKEKGRPYASQLTSSALPMVLKSGTAITIDLQDLTKGGNQKYLSLPARPGDVIMVSGSGEVLVAGWVEKPASYKITPGLTVLGAIQAAGGPHFAADTNVVKVIRSGKDGEKQLFLTDLEKIKRGESKDAPVQDGDVIEVSSSTAKLVPYSFYRFVTQVFNAGFYMR